MNIEIIKQLPITDIDPEYLNNIKFIKEHIIIDYLLGTEEENKFYQIYNRSDNINIGFEKYF